MRGRGWLWGLVVTIALGLGCTSPTLPLPPPALPTVTLGTDASTFHLKSDRGALPNALIVIVNRNETLSRNERVSGTIADAQGSWELDVHGRAGDVVDISQEDGTTLSPSTEVTLK